MVKKLFNILAIIVAIGFVAIQFFRIDKTNPPIVESETINAVVTVPADIALILGRSCNDCHTNKTVYPWYANVQPAAWFLKDHVDHGKEHLNLSVFNTYNANKKVKKLEEVCELVESGEMPLPSYLWIHRDAVLSDSDKKAICDWAKDAAAKLDSADATPTENRP